MGSRVPGPPRGARESPVKRLGRGPTRGPPRSGGGGRRVPRCGITASGGRPGLAGSLGAAGGPPPGRWVRAAATRAASSCGTARPGVGREAQPGVWSVGVALRFLIYPE